MIAFPYDHLGNHFSWVYEKLLFFLLTSKDRKKRGVMSMENVEIFIKNWQDPEQRKTGPYRMQNKPLIIKVREKKAIKQS